MLLLKIKIDSWDSAEYLKGAAVRDAKLQLTQQLAVVPFIMDEYESSINFTANSQQENKNFPQCPTIP